LPFVHPYPPEGAGIEEVREKARANPKKSKRRPPIIGVMIADIGQVIVIKNEA